MSFPEKVKSSLWSIIDKMSQRPGQFAKNPDADFSRKRKLDFRDLLRLLISMQSGTIGHELLKYFDFKHSTASASAFIQQRGKLLLSAFRFLLRQFNALFPCKLYRGKYRLTAVDGSEFNIARNPNDPDSFHPPSGKSTNGFNMIHTTSSYDLINKRYLDCVVQPGRLKNEFRAICDLADRDDFGGLPVYIGDRGFSSYNFFAHAKEKGIFHLIRAKDVNVKRLLGLQSLPDSIDTGIEIILTRTQSKKDRLRPDLDEQYRYISKDVAFDYIEHGSVDEYTLSLRIVRVEVAEGAFVNLITNLPPDDVSTEELKYWYHLRWGIETAFRDLKHTIGAVNFRSKKIEYIEQEIWARLILFNFCSIIATHLVIAQNDTKHVYQVNFAMALKICHHFIRLKDGEPPPDVLALIGKFTLPIRADRKFARKRRFQLPAAFCYRFS